MLTQTVTELPRIPRLAERLNLEPGGTFTERAGEYLVTITRDGAGQPPPPPSHPDDERPAADHESAEPRSDKDGSPPERAEEDKPAEPVQQKTIEPDVRPALLEALAADPLDGEIEENLRAVAPPPGPDPSEWIAQLAALGIPFTLAVRCYSKEIKESQYPAWRELVDLETAAESERSTEGGPHERK